MGTVPVSSSRSRPRGPREGETMTYLYIKQTRSSIGCSAVQRATLQGLGLRGIGRVRQVENTPAVRGMIRQVLHLIDVSDVVSESGS